jgi:cell division protein FtsX
VRVYLSVGATPREARRVLAAARAERGVASASVFSKGAALEAMRQQYPALISHLSSNPFPDSIRLRLTDGVEASRLIANLTAKRLPGIALIRYVTQK